MPLRIVRNDIVNMEADAIVNATNPRLIPGGSGVDAAIHAAAGPELFARQQEILSVKGLPEFGEVIVTESFAIKSCRYVFHAVTPVCCNPAGPGEQEIAILERCYQNILKTAEQYGCTSIAVPVLSAGANGFPKRKAYYAATGVIRSYFEEHDSELEVNLVVFDGRMTGIAQNDFGAICETVDDAYTTDSARRTGLRAKATAVRTRAEACGVMWSLPEMEETSSWPTANSGAAQPLNYTEQDLSFGDMCVWWRERRGLTPNEFYARANISRATFWNTKKNPGTTPKKRIALACAVGLRLNLEETKDLLMRAGLALSPYHKEDEIVSSFIQRGVFDIDEINFELYDNDLESLGSSASDR